MIQRKQKNKTVASTVNLSQEQLAKAICRALEHAETTAWEVTYFHNQNPDGLTLNGNNALTNFCSFGSQVARGGGWGVDVGHRKIFD